MNKMRIHLNNPDHFFRFLLREKSDETQKKTITGFFADKVTKDTAIYNKELLSSVNLDYNSNTVTVILCNNFASGGCYIFKVDIGNYMKTIVMPSYAPSTENIYNKTIRMHQNQFKRITMSYKCPNLIRVNNKLYCDKERLNDH